RDGRAFFEIAFPTVRVPVRLWNDPLALECPLARERPLVPEHRLQRLEQTRHLRDVLCDLVQQHLRARQKDTGVPVESAGRLVLACDLRGRLFVEAVYRETALAERLAALDVSVSRLGPCH